MSEIETFIKKTGEKRDVHSNFQLSLSEKDAVWFLEKGSVNLFAVERKDGNAEGIRSFITNFSSQSLLFQINIDQTSEYEMIGVTEEDSRLWKIPYQAIETYLEQNPLLLNQWINQLAQYYEKELPLEIEKYLDSNSTISLEASEKACLKRSGEPSEKNKLIWITIEKGEVKFLGFPSLSMSEHHASFPLTYHAWVEAQTSAEISASEENPTWKEGLLYFHQIFMKYIHARKEHEDREAKNLFIKQKKNEEKNIHHSLEEMVSILNPIESLKFYGGIDPLFLACQKVGSFMNLTFQMPEETPETEDIHQFISHISHASEIRFRQVQLKGKWWKKDSGPLLAFLGPENRPIALKRTLFLGYQMIDPLTGQKTKINQKIADEIYPFAYVFYRPYPDTLKSAKEALRFFLKANIREFVPLVSYGLIAALLSLVTPFMIQILFNRAIPEVNLPLIWQISIALLLAALSSSVYFFFRSLAFVRIEGLASDQIQSAFWDRLLKLPARFFRSDASGNLISRVISIEKIRSLLSGNINRALFSGIFSFFYIIAMAVFAPALTLIAVGLIFLSFGIAFGFAVLSTRIQKKIYDLQGQINAFLVQIIPSVGKLRTCGAEKNAFSKWAHLFAQNRKSVFDAQSLRNIVTTMNYVLPFILYLSVFAYVIAHPDYYSAGTFLAFNTAFVSFYLATTDLSETLLLVTPAVPLWNRIKVIIEAPLEEKLGMIKPGILKGEIRADELSFGYEESEPNFLEKINFFIHPKEFIGIVGPSGGGKSTLMRLLVCFEKPTSGTIYYDGKDLSTLDIQEVRKQLGVVLQEGGILAGSILDNLVCGGKYTAEDIDQALKISGFAEDLKHLPMGLNTFLPMGGSTLSGGQRQRLLIARAILPHPKILLFDEATSALDNQNQATVIESINQLDVTRIVVAHRLSTIKQADRIYVLDQGKFVQTGTYEELASQPGLFSEMLKRQEL